MAWRKYNQPAVKEARVERDWSNLQRAVFNDIARGTGHTQIDAFAGTGKSTTIAEGTYHVPKGVSVGFFAFAKANVKDLEAKVPAGVDTLTFHSFGYRASRKVFPRVIKPDTKGEKLHGFIKAERGEEPETFDVRDSIAKTVSLAKGYLAETYDEIDAIMDHHDVNTHTDMRESFITTVLKVLDGCKRDTNRMDFDDMIWFPNIFDVPVTQYGMTFIDEDQDLNIAQINLGLKCAGGNGRIISVGDERQAIYGFRGADSNAIQNIVTRLNSKRLTLSVTYRCAKAIVALAQQFVPDLEAAPSAPEGLVQDVTYGDLEHMVRPGDFILSRTNAPLLRQCLALLKANMPANILGRDLGKHMISLIRRSGAASVDGFLDYVNSYEAIEMARLVKANRKTDTLVDKMDCLRALCEGTNSLAQVKDNIKKIFHDGDDTKDRVILSTTHRAKGMERDKVFMLAQTYKPGIGNIEEDNLTYVAYTRAKRALYLVRD